MPTDEKTLFRRRGAALALSPERILIIVAPVRENPAPDLTQVQQPLSPAELALLREFFELLAEWHEAQQGEPRDD